MTLVVRDVVPEEHDAFLDCHLIGQAYRMDAERRPFVLEQLADPECRKLGAFEDGVLIGVCLDFVIELTVPGGASVPVGGMTWLAVLPTHRRRGVMRALFEEHHAGFRERGLAAGALHAARSSVYRRFGYGPAVWSASLSIETQYGAFRSPPPEGSLALIDAAELPAVAPAIWSAMRRVRPGALDRSPLDWDWEARFPGKKYFCVYHDEGGVPRAYVAYTVNERWGSRPDPAGRVEVAELIGADAGAEAALWRYLLDLDHVTEMRAPHRPVDEPLRHRLAEPRRLCTHSITDSLWIAPLDPVRLLTTRHAGAAGRLTLAVDDLTLHVEAGEDGTIECETTSREPDVVLDGPGFASVVLGGASVTTVVAGGQGRLSDAAAGRRADAILAWSPQPWCALEF